MPTILIVDDEPDIVDLVSYHLKKAGHETRTAHDGIEALRLIKEEIPDLIVLDLMLPQKDGIAVFRDLQAQPETASIPVLMLTALDQHEDVIKGLELGADDYMTKPFSNKELVLRVQALLRRTGATPENHSVEVDGFRLDKSMLRFYLDNQEVDLTLTEFKLLLLLIERRGKTQKRETLLKEIWGYNDQVYTRTLDTHVKRLREKLGEEARRIVTVRGVGYQFLSNLAESS